MRDIKFKMWTGGELVGPFKLCNIDKSDGATTVNIGGRHYYLEADDNILRFTGLKDKNGKEIYEGDVVKDISDTSEAYPDRNVLVGPVKLGEYWTDEDQEDIHVGWYLDADFGSWVGAREALPSGLCAEVIGNIHENPELVKQEVST